MVTGDRSGRQSGATVEWSSSAPGAAAAVVRIMIKSGVTLLVVVVVMVGEASGQTEDNWEIVGGVVRYKGGRSVEQQEEGRTEAGRVRVGQDPEDDTPTRLVLGLALVVSKKRFC